MKRFLNTLGGQNQASNPIPSHRSPLITPQKISRRDLLKMSGGVTAAVVLGSASNIVLLPALNSGDSKAGGDSPLLQSDFVTQLGEPFKVHKDALQSVVLTLEEVSSLRGHNDHSFSLIFSGLSTEPLGQMTYDVEHPILGRFPVFLVPMYPEKGQLNYQAVFNRL